MTPPLLNKRDNPILAVAEAESESWQPSTIVADIATLGTGTLLAGLVNVALVFVVPKLLSVEDYGYWRMFGLYAGYVGFLHFGFADGALLRWAARPTEQFHHELWQAMKYLLWQHLAVVVPGCIAALLLSGPLRFVVVAVGLYALLFNQVTLLQFSLQGAKIFRPVAVSTVAAPALFLGFVLVWHSKWQSDFHEVTVLFEAGWLIVLVFLLAWIKPWTGTRSQTVARGLGKQCVLTGWPIVLANTGVMLIVFADRLALSWAASIQNFAQYSLAASAMAVPITAIAACSKVFFSHLAGVTPEGRKRIYGISSRMLLIAWTILLPYYFALDLFLHHVLPRYISSLVYARILLLGIPFLAAIQILQMSYTYLSGMQKRFLKHTSLVLVLSLGIIFFAAFRTGSLRTIAVAQVAILGGWWLFNEWTLRKTTGARVGEWAKFLGIYGLATATYWIATHWPRPYLVGAVLFYYALVGFALYALAPRELRMCMHFTQERDDKWSGKEMDGLELLSHE